jgi:hypothetical protein
VLAPPALVTAVQPCLHPHVYHGWRTNRHIGSQLSSAASDPNATDEDKEIEQWKIRKLIKNLEAARG